MKWIGQHIYDQVSKFRNTVDFSEDVTFYQPVNNANPGISIGANDDERLLIYMNYQGSASQTAQQATFVTFTESATANDGSFAFAVDQDQILRILDGGIDFGAGKGIGINGVDILTDNGSGTATLSNIDALDATTIATLNSALTAGDITGVTAGTGLSGGGTSGAVTLNVDASLSHLSSIILDVDKSVTPGDGAVIHVDAHTVTDSNTSGSGTAALYTHVKIEAPRLGATNSSVTTTSAASLYIQGAPTPHTNQTITNPYALWVDDGLVKFDGALTVGGTITGNVTGDVTGDVTGNVSGTAATVTTAAQPAIESIGTDGDTLSILADTLLMSNTTADTPVIKLLNTTDDDQAGQLIFEKLRDDDAVAQGQNLGEIWFHGQDTSQNTQKYGYIASKIDVSTNTQESGQLLLGVSAHNGNNAAGLILTGGSEAAEIDVTIGLGANSVVTIPGDIDLAGDIDVDGTLETDALTIGGATIAAIGTTAITTLGTIGTGVWNGTKLTADYTTHSQIINLKGYCTLEDDNYKFAQDYEDNQAPWDLSQDYTSGTISDSTEINQRFFFRGGGFHVPVACTLHSIQVQASVDGAGGGNVTVAIAEYVPSEHADDRQDYPRTVYEEVVVGSNNHNDKIKTVNIASAALDATAIAAGSHLLIMAKGDGDTDTDTANISVAMEIRW
tara:strand:- start:478 stop:2499 length:2022 start_codon:yes stop_codon:yes gene_type:complete